MKAKWDLLFTNAFPKQCTYVSAHWICPIFNVQTIMLKNSTKIEKNSVRIT